MSISREVEKDDLYQKALQAITDLFSDMSVPQSITKEKLGELIEEIKIMIDTLE